jgi:cytochrome c556
MDRTDKDMKQMRKDVDALAKHDRERGPWDSEHRRAYDAKQAKLKSLLKGAGELCICGLFGIWFALCLYWQI